MATKRRLIHFQTFDNFNWMKLSANEDNTQYTIGINGAITSGTDIDVPYQAIAFIKDTEQIWTHGKLYNNTQIIDLGTMTIEEDSFTFTITESGNTIYNNLKKQQGNIIFKYLIGTNTKYCPVNVIYQPSENVLCNWVDTGSDTRFILNVTSDFQIITRFSKYVTMEQIQPMRQAISTAISASQTNATNIKKVQDSLDKLLAMDNVYAIDFATAGTILDDLPSEDTGDYNYETWGNGELLVNPTSGNRTATYVILYDSEYLNGITPVWTEFISNTQIKVSFISDKHDRILFISFYVNPTTHTAWGFKKEHIVKSDYNFLTFDLGTLTEPPQSRSFTITTDISQLYSLVKDTIDNYNADSISVKYNTTYYPANIQSYTYDTTYYVITWITDSYIYKVQLLSPTKYIGQKTINDLIGTSLNISNNNLQLLNDYGQILTEVDLTPTITDIATDIATDITTDIAGKYNELQPLKSTGILWSNLFVGADMEKGYTESNIPGFSTYPSLGGTIERILDNETSRYCIKGYFPEGTNFNEFAHPKLFNDINFVGENTTQEFSISFRYKCTSNLQNIHLLCNNSFMEYTDINGTPISKMPLIKDNNWHYVHVIAKKSGVTNKNYTIGLYIFFSGIGSNTLTSDLEFYITDIVISTSKFPDYAVVRNVNDYITPVNKETIKPVVNEIINEYPDIHNCVFMSLGDSITTEGYYIDKLRQLIFPSKYYNLAVSGAHWADYVNTIYDGNPVFGGDNVNNTLGNQVQKIINNPDIYNTAPDVIIIAAGTNDTTPITADKTNYEMKVEIDSHFNENSTTPIQVTEPTFDESDTYKEHRRTIAGAMRYCILKLQSLYPNARIYILTPIQGSYNPNKDYLTQIEIKQRYITEVAKHLSVPVIHVGEECGINRDFEYGGTYWKEEWDPNNYKTGRDLIDGLHPNTNGSWKMAKYIYNKLKNDYIDLSY